MLGQRWVMPRQLPGLNYAYATREHCYKYCVQFLSVCVASICNACTRKKLVSTSKLLGSTAIDIACSFFLHALRVFVMRALEKNSRARANYSGALL